MIRNAKVWAQNNVDGSVVLSTQTCDVDISSRWIFIVPGQRRRKDSSPIFQYPHVGCGTMSNFLDVVGIKAAASVWKRSTSMIAVFRDIVLTPAVKHVMCFIQYDTKPNLTRVHKHRAFL